MADISFNEPQYKNASRPGRGSFLSSLAIKSGLAKDEQGAQRVLLVAAILIAAFAVGVYVFAYPTPTTLPPDDPSFTG